LASLSALSHSRAGGNPEFRWAVRMHSRRHI
jgi:hypothetical protein